MKICIINNLYPPHARGGAEQVVRKTVEGLLDAGHEVVLITTCPDGDYVWWEEELTIYRFRPWNFFFYTDASEHSFFARVFWHLVDIFHFKSADYVRGVLKKEKPDVVHTHNLMGVGFLVPRVVRELGIRYVHHVHDVQLVEPSGIILKENETGWRYNGWHVKVYIWIMKKLMGSPDVVVSPSKFLKGFYKDRGFFENSKLVVVRNPLTVDIQPVSRGQEDMVFRFLYLGQVEEHKGLRLLVNAFKIFVKKNNLLCKLYIVGSGSLSSKIDELSKDCEAVKIYGRVSREKLPAIFQHVDMTIVPSLCYENSPTVIFESFAFGIPVLASNIEGVAELIEEGKNGITFRAGSIDELVEKMEWCLLHRDDVRRMGEDALSTLSGLSQEEYIGELVKLYS